MTSLLSTSALPLRLVLGPGSFEYLVKQPLVSFARYAGGEFPTWQWGGGDVSEIFFLVGVCCFFQPFVDSFQPLGGLKISLGSF